MQIYAQVLSLVTLLSLTSTAMSGPLSPRQVAPRGYIYTTLLPRCVGGNVAGAPVNAAPTGLPLNVCVDISLFLSFKGGISQACPAGKAGFVVAFPQKGCTGTGLSGGPLPTTEGPGDCKDILADTSATPPSPGGQSAKFYCY